MSLRELTRRLIAADQKGLVVRSRADDKQRQYLIFERIALPDGRVWHVSVAYDRPRTDELEAVARLIQEQVVKVLRDRLASMK
jgi:hypothetical protein